MPLCQGCGKHYRGGAYTRHMDNAELQPTSACGRWALGLDSRIFQNYTCNPISSQSNTPRSSNGSATPDIRMTFEPEGDFYGNYADLDEDRDLTFQSPSSSSSEDSDDDLRRYEDTWEATPPPSPTMSNLGSPPSSPSVHSPSHLPPPYAYTNPPPELKEPFVEKYPDRRAGAPVQNESLRKEHEREEYGRKWDGTNIWAPFESEIDWRLAKWAKTRGPSSTALSELLAIPEYVHALVTKIIF